MVIDGPSLQVREILAIDVLARARSFKIAAAEMNTTQPTLSRLIASAEKELGVKLFSRGWSGAETTPRGDVVARCCRQVIVAIEDAQRRIFGDRKNNPSFVQNLTMANLRAIEAVARESNVSLAARQIGRSQPDLSRALSDVAKRFGVDLFRRTGSGMVPQDTALVLSALSSTLTELLKLLEKQLSHLDGVVVGRVSIGMLPFSGQDLIPKAFARLANAYPNISLTCVPGSYNSLVEALRRREIDRLVGILREHACPPGLEEHHLYDEQFAVVAREDHPLATGSQTINDLAGANWIVAPHGTPVRAYFEYLFSQSDAVPPTQTCEMLSFSSAEQMLLESNSLAMLTYSPRKLANLRAELRQIDTPTPNASAPIGYTLLSDASPDSALSEFDRILTELVGRDASPEGCPEPAAP